MKTLLKIVVLAAVCFAFNANALTLDERIAKVETKYEQRIEKIGTMRGTEARKEVLKKHAREDADLKIQHLKDLDEVKVKAAEARKAASEAKKAAKAEAKAKK